MECSNSANILSDDIQDEVLEEDDTQTFVSTHFSHLMDFESHKNTLTGLNKP